MLRGTLAATYEASGICYAHLPTAIGPLRIVDSADGLLAIWFETGRRRRPPVESGWRQVDPQETEAGAQLIEYFAGTRRRFVLRRAALGRPFQRRVWDAVAAIPYGETRSYGAVAAQIGAHGAARAVGLANGQNPWPIIVPCHRVIGADGSLTGYGGGLPLKRALLDFERGACSLFPPLGEPGLG
jgi:methylated-DNA-[protein]-cysteine S-methyltransferase